MSKGGSSRTGTRSAPGSAAGTVLAFTYRDGDILLRAGEEAWIQEITGGLYSHAGIVVEDSTDAAADAHPADAYRSAGHEVARLPIADFFSVAHAPGGGDVFRYRPSAAHAEAAARWADSQVGLPYTFDILDPILGSGGAVVEDNELYCSEFVWRAYKNGAGVELVKPKDFINLLSSENIDRTVRVLTPIVREQEGVKWIVPDFVVRRRLRKELKKRHNGYFVSPSQLGESPLVDKVHSIRGGAQRAQNGKKT